MDVADLFLADYASVNERGKFTLVGAGFTEIITRKMPCVHPLMFVLLRMKVTKADIGRNRVRLSVNGHGKELFTAQINIDITEDQQGVKYYPLPAQISHLKFEQPGEYKIEAFVNGECKRSQDLTVKYIRPSKDKL